MTRHDRRLMPAFAVALVLAAPAWADRTVTDQIGRQVTLPDSIERAVILQHQTLNIAAQLDAQDQVVGCWTNGKSSFAPASSGWRRGSRIWPCRAG